MCQFETYTILLVAKIEEEADSDWSGEGGSKVYSNDQPRKNYQLPSVCCGTLIEYALINIPFLQYIPSSGQANDKEFKRGSMQKESSGYLPKKTLCSTIHDREYYVHARVNAWRYTSPRSCKAKWSLQEAISSKSVAMPVSEGA